MHYVVTTTLPRTFGGRTKALLKRTKLLTTKFNLKFTILSTNYDPNFHEIKKKYLNHQWITEDTILQNMYSFFINASSDHHERQKTVSYLEDKVYIHDPVDNFYKYYKNQTELKSNKHFLYRKYSSDGLLVFEDYMRDKRRYLRKEYNKYNQCHKKTYFYNKTLLKDKELFLNSQGQVYLVKHYLKDDTNSLEYIDLTYKGVNYLFNTERELIQFFFENAIKENSKVFCDARYLDVSLIKSNISVDKIFILHNSHIDENKSGKVKNSYRYLLENSDKVDSIICLTSEQYHDLLSLPYNIDKNKISVIPHFMPSSKAKIIRKIDQKKFIYLGRLQFNKQKQINHAIEAFSIFLKKNPGYTLDIIGSGQDKAALKKLVKQKKLEDHINFCGATTDISEVFTGATGTLVTSKYEGFCMVIMESLYYQCPVISYACKYGPKDLIKDAENGFLVEKDNINAFADKMALLVKSSVLNSEISLHPKFTIEKVLSKWENLLLNNS